MRFRLSVKFWESDQNLFTWLWTMKTACCHFNEPWSQNLFIFDLTWCLLVTCSFFVVLLCQHITTVKLLFQDPIFYKAFPHRQPLSPHICSWWWSLVTVTNSLRAQAQKQPISVRNTECLWISLWDYMCHKQDLLWFLWAWILTQLP